MKNINIATFNVRGLTKELKQEHLATDISKYNVDVCCVQETKIKDGVDKNINGSRLICLNSESKHYGNGFIVSNAWKDHIHKYWRVTDRVAVLQLKLNNKNRKPMLINIINVYAPHTQRVKDDYTELDVLYDVLNDLILNFKNMTRSYTIIAGDFNAKVGKQLPGEKSIGKYSRGRRNTSGQTLLDFCDSHDLVISNSCFQHPAKHQTTWQQTRKNKDNALVTIYNQIDYVIIPRNKKHLLTDARSYSGTSIDSDHRIVVCRSSMELYRFYKKVEKERDVKYDTRRLVNDLDTRRDYEKVLKEKLREKEVKWDVMKDVILETADEVLGKFENQKQVKQFSVKIDNLSKISKDLRIQIQDCKNTEQYTTLKKERNKVTKLIKREVKRTREKQIDKIVEDISKTKDDSKMFQAVRSLHLGESVNSFIYDKDRRKITNIRDIHETVKNHYQSKFYDQNHHSIIKIEECDLNKPLTNPISSKEVKQCISKMKNNKAAGHDNITVEMIKYADLEKEVAEVLNNVVEGIEDFDLSKSLLKYIPKPGKEKGPVENLRPINLLPILRKILSNVTLHRIKEKVDTYLSDSQSAYRQGRSTTDIIWAYRWICAAAQKYVNTKILITGIDMSSAFDTINRYDLLNELKTFLNEDEIRLCKILLSDTTIAIKDQINDKDDTFESNIGSPQGDGISGTFFNVYLEKELRKVRYFLNINSLNHDHHYVRQSSLPSELVYADDTDFMTESEHLCKLVTENVEQILGEGNLKVNPDKTEQTVIERGDKTTEDWRGVKKLGSLLGDTEDIIRRKSLATAAFTKMKKVWIRNGKVHINKRIKLYNTLVKPILTYNSGTWGMTKKEEESLNAFHRKQLRKVWCHTWRHRVTNENLYKTSNAKPLTDDIKKARWRTMGHILRLKENTPAQKSMKYYFENCDGRKRFRGRPRTTLPIVIEKDIKSANNADPVLLNVSSFNCMNDLENIKQLAQDRKRWKDIVELVCRSG